MQHGTLKRQLDKPGQKISFVVRKISNLQRANFFVKETFLMQKKKKHAFNSRKPALKLHTCGL